MYSETMSRRYTEVRVASLTHFYGSGIWVNVLKERYNAFFQAVQS